MRVLLIHPNFPAQFRHLAQALGEDQAVTVVFATAAPRPEWEMPGVNKLVYQDPPEEVSGSGDLAPVARAHAKGEAVAEALLQLKARRFTPDVIYGHSGWGTTLYVKDVFPNTPFLGYFEWFYDPKGADFGFGRKKSPSFKARCRLRLKNFPILNDLQTCDQGICPMAWQKRQFPKDFLHKISVVHDGIDTEYFQPAPGKGLQIGDLQLQAGTEIVTYAARGMEPYRGFPQFMESLPLILEKRPNCRVLIAGTERVCYGPERSDGKTYKQAMLETVNLDPERVHFVGTLPYGQYKQVLQASSVHVYLTRPFVLSWSLLEAMACGCVVVGSDTEPVREVIQDGQNGFLTDFFSPKKIAERVAGVLEYPSFMAPIRRQARQTILEKYSLKGLLPKQIHSIQTIAGGAAQAPRFG
ncbi:MAG: glycosyltransferase [Desulfohalobiaceae bacterium]|nr:glycosyltransferase [Desulfohalobiaceae bacterium]